HLGCETSHNFQSSDVYSGTDELDASKQYLCSLFAFSALLPSQLLYQLLQQAMGKNYVVFIPRHYPKDNDCWRGQRWYGESEYRPLASFDPDLHALARDLEPGVVFFAVFYGTHFLFVERQTMRSFKCAYGHHRWATSYLNCQDSGIAFTSAFTSCIDIAAEKRSSDGLFTSGYLSSPYAAFIAAGLNPDRLLNEVFGTRHSTDKYPCLIQNVSELDLQDIGALVERVRTDERGLNQGFFRIIDNDGESRFVSMDTGKVYQCYDGHRQSIIDTLRYNSSLFGKLKEMAEECDNNIYLVDMKVEPIENFLNEGECDGKLYAMDGTELKDGDVVHIDISDDYGSVDEFSSALCGTSSDVEDVIGFRVRTVDGKWYLRQVLSDGSDGRYLSVALNEESEFERDYVEAVLKSNEVPVESERIVFRRHKKFKRAMLMAKATSKNEVAYIEWVKWSYGGISFDAKYGDRLNIRFVRGKL
ncbi:hypothetical protein GQ42DRAFT_172012, partial [Ramicandelaber brevisporus]